MPESRTFSADQRGQTLKRKIRVARRLKFIVTCYRKFANTESPKIYNHGAWTQLRPSRPDNLRRIAVRRIDVLFWDKCRKIFFKTALKGNAIHIRLEASASREISVRLSGDIGQRFVENFIGSFSNSAPFPTKFHGKVGKSELLEQALSKRHSSVTGAFAVGTKLAIYAGCKLCREFRPELEGPEMTRRSRKLLLKHHSYLIKTRTL